MRLFTNSGSRSDAARLLGKVSPAGKAHRPEETDFWFHDLSTRPVIRTKLLLTLRSAAGWRELLIGRRRMMPNNDFGFLVQTEIKLW